MQPSSMPIPTVLEKEPSLPPSTWSKRARWSFQSPRFLSFLLLVVLFIFWEFGVRALRIPRFLVPPLSDVLKALWSGLATGPMARDGFWFHSGVTLLEVLLGFFIGSAIGLVLGIAISQVPKLEGVLQPYIVAFQSLPKVAVAPIIVMWMGFGISSKVAIVCLLTFFPVLVTSIAGFRAVDIDRIDLMRSLSATQWQIFRKAKFPSALPFIFAGLDMAAAFAVVGAIVGEFVGAQSGLGVLILQLDAQMDTGGSFAVFIILSLMGVAISSVLRVIRRRALSWMPEETGTRAINV